MQCLWDQIPKEAAGIGGDRRSATEGRREEGEGKENEELDAAGAGGGGAEGGGEEAEEPKRVGGSGKSCSAFDGPFLWCCFFIAWNERKKAPRFLRIFT